MEQKGAKISEIQRKLGHTNIATTSLYLQAFTNKDETWRPEALFHTANSDVQCCTFLAFSSHGESLTCDSPKLSGHPFMCCCSGLLLELLLLAPDHS